MSVTRGFAAPSPIVEILGIGPGALLSEAAAAEVGPPWLHVWMFTKVDLALKVAPNAFYRSCRPRKSPAWALSVEPRVVEDAPQA